MATTIHANIPFFFFSPLIPYSLNTHAIDAIINPAETIYKAFIFEIMCMTPRDKDIPVNANANANKFLDFL